MYYKESPILALACVAACVLASGVTLTLVGCDSDQVTPPLIGLPREVVVVNNGLQFTASLTIPVRVCEAGLDSVRIWNGAWEERDSGTWYRAAYGCVEIAGWGIGSTDGPVDVSISAVVNGESTRSVETVVILDRTAPVIAAEPTFPATSASGISIATDLAWPMATDQWCPADSIVYTVLAGPTTSPSDTVYIGRRTACVVPGLVANSECYWQVRATDAAGNTADGMVWSFGTWTWDLPEFQVVRAGPFTMGSPALEFGREDDEVQHEVTITRDFLMATTELSIRQYLPILQWAYDRGYTTVEGDTVKSTIGPGAYPLIYINFYAENDIYFADGTFSTDSPDRIARSISWYGAVALNAWLSELAGDGVRVPGAGDWETATVDPYAIRGFRLPTEAEWEYACRGGAATAFANGEIGDDQWYDPVLEDIGWYYNNYGDFHFLPGQKIPNQYGLYDMHGGTPEWCWDWYGPYPAGAVVDPVNSPDSGAVLKRAMRGSLEMPGPRTYDCRSAHRYAIRPRDYILDISSVRIVWSHGE